MSPSHSRPVADLFEDPASGLAWDEMFERPEAPRPACAADFDVLQPLGAAGLR